MPNNTLDSDSQFIDVAITKLLNEEAIFHPIQGSWEGRSALRREFVRAIAVVFENGLTVEGYSRNISTEGVEIITQQLFQIDAKAIVHIANNDQSEGVKLVAECRWAHDDGAGGKLSGWTFIKSL